MIKFLRANLRWLSAGFLLTFTSAFGQTWFISLFAGAIKAEYGLSDGAWGGLYSIATLSAAGLLFCWGSAADTVPPAGCDEGYVASPLYWTIDWSIFCSAKGRTSCNSLSPTPRHV